MLFAILWARKLLKVLAIHSLFQPILLTRLIGSLFLLITVVGCSNAMPPAHQQLLRPASHCDDRQAPSRGIVLMHGLADMPASMRDIAQGFSDRCFVAHSLLLPGHGARPAELLAPSLSRRRSALSDPGYWIKPPG